jgi:hypothetical protein
MKALTPLQGAGGFLHYWIGQCVKEANLIWSLGEQRDKPLGSQAAKVKMREWWLRVNGGYKPSDIHIPKMSFTFVICKLLFYVHFTEHRAFCG